MSKKNFQGASTALVKELGDFHSGYFDHSHIIAAENKAFVKGFEPHISDSSMRPLREAYQNSAETAVAMDAVLANAKALNQAASIASTVSVSCRSALQQEATHISHRLTTRESKEPFQDKEMSDFLALQQEEKAKLDAAFEKRRAELEAEYTV